MPDRNPVIVLKFGGSVLLDDQRLRIAVHEIYRWRREGWRVLAVVSALAGRTEELISRCETLSESVSPQARAGIIGLGERESMGLLGVHLDRAGIPACTLTPEAVHLRASGPALDATPEALDAARLRQSLDEYGVVVFPGFVAVDQYGASVTLGRGGSDLTAVFLAHQLGADKCRLIKDVDGLYESDPAKTESPPRYAYASYEDALNTDGSIIHHKAVQYARHHQLSFELGRFNGSRPTTIGPSDSTLSTVPDRPTRRTLAICGLGVVGEGVLELVQQLPEHFDLKGCARRTIRPEDLNRGTLVTDNPVSLASSGVDIVVEVMGGTHTAWDVAQAAISSGSAFVTANKSLIAEHGDGLASLAEVHGQQVLFSASVGGVTPVLEAVRDREVISVEGVLNGTGNFVLGSLEAGLGLKSAVLEAQRLGFAESDPSRDIEGLDALDKLLVIAQSQQWSIPADQRSTQSIADWSGGSDLGYPARQVARVDASSARVNVETVKADSTFGLLQDEWNAAIITYSDGSQTELRGKGAGCWPTSEAVLADLLELSRSQSANQSRKEACYA